MRVVFANIPPGIMGWVIRGRVGALDLHGIYTEPYFYGVTSRV